MQLDAFLRSQDEHAPYEQVRVLYRCAPGPQMDSYVELIDEWRHKLGYIGWWSEPDGGFEYSVRSFLIDRERVVFHTDDDVFFERSDLLPYSSAEFDGPISLRLGANTTYCHPLDCEQAVPERGRGWNPWRWREAQGDFGYPLCLNGTVYRSTDLLPLIEGWHFTNPTELEAGLAYRADLFQPEYMTAPLHSCCVSLPHNRVSSSSGCRTGSNPAWQPDRLCEMFLDGYRIDLDRMDFSNIVGAHQEVPLAFTRRQG